MITATRCRADGENGKPTGKYEIFADGFAGAVKEPGRAAQRLAGLAVGPDLTKGKWLWGDGSSGR